MIKKTSSQYSLHHQINSTGYQTGQVLIFSEKLCLFFLILMLFTFGCGLNRNAELDHLPFLNEKLFLTPNSYIFVDLKGDLGVDKISSPAFFMKFKVNTSQRLSLAVNPAKTWVRFKLSPDVLKALGHGPWTLELASSLADRATLYVPDPLAKHGLKEVRADRRGTENPHDVKFRNLSFTLDSPASPQSFYYLKMEASRPAVLPLVLRSWKGFYSYASYDYLVFGMLYGTIGCMLFYNLFIFFSLRDKIYLVYVAYMLSFLFYFPLLNGQIGTVIDIDPLELQTWERFFLGGSIFFACSFCRLFFRTWQSVPRWDLVVRSFQIMALVIIALGLVGLFYWAAWLAKFAGAFGPLSLVVAAVLCGREGARSAKYYLTANIFLMAGTLIYVLWSLGIVKKVPGDILFTLGPAIEAVLLSFALGDRIKYLKHQTHALAASEAVYKRASETDGLTGLFNKRYLMEQLEGDLAKTDAKGQQLCLIIMDVDHFKRFNDTYGHPEGDKVLVTLAQIISASIRFRDYGCRFGGEEFSITLPDTDLKSARIVAERIRERFGAHGFNPGEAKNVFVTVSMGLAQYSPGEGAVNLIKRADSSLYQAKAMGRDLLVIAE
ncbi:hypothetical protein X474_18120 [Dethiosulfatarculus sandiegensis]|uniref:diguanylate cyclase n=2 Tax=Dethiosulfatarculus sandiegensis TaxID=1429043 RepID=A0A0D2JSU1_9BACT|nr:hypothetical protein X474_18120 [Dethiosulfatarculus sandiegensis]